MALHKFLNNFTSGEWTPLLDGRSDLEQYDNASRIMENWRPMQYGGARFRTGMEFVVPAKFGNRKHRLLPFNFSTATRFVLEFGHEYVRFITNGMPVMMAAKTITDMTTANPAVFTSAAHGFSNGQEVELNLLVGPVALNGRRFLVTNVATDTFRLTTKAGVVVDGTALPAYVSGGTAAAPYEVATTYDEADLFGLQFKQINDLMYIVHPDYAPRKLSRVSNTNWTFEVVDFDQAPLLDENITATTLTCSHAAVGAGRTLTASAATFNAGHVGAIFQLSHDLAAASIELNITATATSGVLRVQGAWGIQTSGTWTGTIEVERSIDGGAYEVIRKFTGAADRNVSGSGLETKDAQLRLKVTYTSHSGTPVPRVWLEAENATISGLVEVTAYTSSTVVTVTVVTELAATTATKFWREGAWSTYRGFPRSVGVYEQRLYFGGTASFPTRFWGSKSGDFENFEDGSLDDDGVSFVVASAESNPILWLEGLDVLQIGTAGGEIVARAGSQDEPLTPSNVSVRAQSAYGSDIIQALSVGDAVLFLQRQGRRLREMAYTIEKDRYVSPDLTLLSEHITQSGILQLGFARQPDPTVMLVRADGQLAVLTYNREQNVTAWARWVTDGAFESVASIYGDPVDEIWFSVRRTVDGETVRYIERMAIEVDADAEVGSSEGGTGTAQVVFLVDSSGSMGGIINSVKAQIEDIADLYLTQYSSVTFALSEFQDEGTPINLTDFTTKEAIVALLDDIVTAGGDEPGFEAIRTAMEGVTWISGSARFAIMFTDEESSTGTCSEEDATNALLAKGCIFSYGPDLLSSYTPIQEATGGVFFDDIDDIAGGLLPSVFIQYQEFYLDCALTGRTLDGILTGLSHLEGRTVRVVLNDAVMGDFVVTAGTITLPTGSAGSYVVGLPYTGTLKTMRLDTNLANGPSQGRKRRITEVAFRFNGTQGCKFGKSLTALTEIPFRTFADNPSVGVPRFTGEKLVTWPMGYDTDAVVYVVQDQPLPCTLLGLAIKHDFMGD